MVDKNRVWGHTTVSPNLVLADVIRGSRRIWASLHVESCKLPPFFDAQTVLALGFCLGKLEFEIWGLPGNPR